MADTKYNARISSYYVIEHNELVRVVTGKSMGRAAWWIIQVLPHKFESYRTKVTEGLVDLDQYSKVLTKGWGMPPENIVRAYEAQYA